MIKQIIYGKKVDNFTNNVLAVLKESNENLEMKIIDLTANAKMNQVIMDVNVKDKYI